MTNYDLEERTTKFAEEIVELCKLTKITEYNKNIIEQLLRAGTSVGANYFEANGAESKKDFRHKIHICKKEAKESMYWLRLFAKTGLINDLLQKTRNLWQEAKELSKIFAKIGLTTKIEN